MAIWHSKSTRALILANLVPLFGVLFFGWNLYSILFSYWTETAVIGFYNLLKMKRAAGPVYVHEGKITSHPAPTDQPVTGQSLSTMRFFLLPFFALHYGGFMAGHFFFLFSILPELSPGEFALHNLFQEFWLSISLVIASLIISHGISYQENFIQNEEYKKTNAALQMFAPYKRIVVMHLTIILGAFALLLAGGYNLILLCIFILLKIWVDILFHKKTHIWNTQAQTNPTMNY